VLSTPPPGATGNDVNSAGNLSLSSFSFSFVRNGRGVPSEARSLTRGKRKIPEVTSLPVAPASAIVLVLSIREIPGGENENE
jgi:hypothetical protein